MKGIIKRDPGQRNLSVSPLGNLVDNFFQENLSRFFNDGFSGLGDVRNADVPVNVWETDKTYEIDVVAPGLKKDDFKIDINDNRLTVSFEHREENKEGDKNTGWIRQEYKHQSFNRSFNLDETVDSANISAKYNDGLLHLILPKKEGAQQLTRTVEIQ